MGRDNRMLENEKLFRAANERLLDRIEDLVPPGRPVPFLCECLNDLCLARLELTLEEYRHVRANGDSFAVSPGHVAPDGEVVVEERGTFQVVRKDPS